MPVKRTFDHLIEGELMRCITIAPQEVELPSYLLQGEKEKGYLYDEGTLTSWYWKGISIIEGERCLYFDHLQLFPFAEIATKKRDKALLWVRRLADALSRLSSEFLDLSSGILPLWRVWGIEDGRLLILPQTLGDLFSSTAEEDDRYQNISAWVHHGIHAPFSLCDQMGQLLYYAALGFAPFADRLTREDAFRPLPITSAQTPLAQSTAAFIHTTLTLSLTRQRDAAGNKESQAALSTFLEQTEKLAWDLESLDQAPVRDAYLSIEACRKFVEAQTKRANRKIFWRKKGWIVITVVLSVGAVAWFTTSRIQLALTPPYTAGMSQVQVVEEYYAGQNSLDLQKMEASLAKGTKNPASMEVTNLFVTRQTRQAYEGINSQVDPNRWIADGKPALVEGTFLYGVADLGVVQQDETTFTATGTLYTPYSYADEGEEQVPTEGVPIYLYRITQQFSVELGKRGWYEITGIEAVNVEFLERLVVPTQKRF
ncbi:MAG: hypothetical protein PHY87_06845 [Sphaerochaeta sp.]|nr:hypothetical protein [Sphaerochaeta sp.]MDD3929495.1 hypothetical protein [Sphaerochaeta sp.]